MSDRGEKIVSLAQEMLRKNHLESPALQQERIKISEKGITVKTACLAALLAATGSVAVANIIHEHIRPANRYERVEIDALVFYAARQLKVGEELMRHEVHDAIGLARKQDYSVSDYNRARNYLWMRLQGKQN